MNANLVFIYYFWLQHPIFWLLELFYSRFQAAKFFKEHAHRCELFTHWLFEHFTRLFVRKGSINSNCSFFHSFFVGFPFERVTGFSQVFDTFLSVYQEKSSVATGVAIFAVVIVRPVQRVLRICGRRKRQNYHNWKANREYGQTQTSKLPQYPISWFFKCVRVGGPNVTVYSNPNNWFKLMQVLGPSCLPLIKQDSNFWKDCIFYWCEIAPLDSYFLILRISIVKSSSNSTILVILVPIWLKSVFGARLWRIKWFNCKLMITAYWRCSKSV